MVGGGEVPCVCGWLVGKFDLNELFDNCLAEVVKQKNISLFVDCQTICQINIK